MVKQMKIKSLLCLILTLVCTTGNAASAETKSRLEGPDDFAFGATLSVDGNAPFYRIKLPETVYLNTAWSDLRDVRVFNGVGQPLPISLIHYNNVFDETTTLPMTLFEMNSEIKKQWRSDDRTASLTTSDGVTVNIPLEKDRSISKSYLLKRSDNAPKSQSPERFILDWSKSDKNWQTQVSVYYSDTTSHWNTLVTDAPLMDLTSGDEKLLINNIELGNRQRYGSVYYLLVFKDDINNPPPLIKSVDAVYSDKRRQSEFITMEFTGRLTDDGEAEYELPTPQPLQTLQILPAKDNVVLPLDIEYRSNASEDWKSLPRQVVYQLINNESEKTQSKPIDLNGRLIQGIRIKAVNSSWGDNLPSISGERKQMTLIFNAQGNDPYLLAWGAYAAAPQAIALDSLIPPASQIGQDLNAIAWASVVDQFVLGGEARLKQEQPDDSVQWQTFLLWAILVLGVAGLGLFAFKIWQEMKQKSDSAD